MKDKKNILIIALTVFLMGVGLPAVSMAVSASAECAYNADKLFCSIYVDTVDGAATAVDLRSGGLKLSYNPSELLGPAGLTRPIATKNEIDWFFGAASQDPALAYMDPETATDGEVVFIVGKLDTTPGFQGGGVSGERVPIGTVTFARSNPGDPVGDPGATFGIDLGLGRIAPYANFVDAAGDPGDPDAILDGDITFSKKVVEAGDVNANGSISSIDLALLRSILRNGSDYVVYADLNGNGSISSIDFALLRAKLLP